MLIRQSVAWTLQPMRTVRAALREIVHEQIEFRELLFQMTSRDLLLRYKQTAMGFGWAVLMPLLNTAIFSIVFMRVAPVHTRVPYPLFAYCGLMVWNFNRMEIEAMTDEARRAHMSANRHASRHPYTPGHLAVHSGHQLHQMAPAHDPQPTDERITMQAHALPVDGRWVIYW